MEKNDNSKVRIGFECYSSLIRNGKELVKLKYISSKSDPFLLYSPT